MKPDFLDLAELKHLMDVLGAGRTRVVGGAVRDALMGRLVADVDLATELLPPAVMEKAERAGFQVVPTGLQHGTVTIVINHRSFEVTTLRRDEETDGRHAVVAFGQSWQEDAQRRDFTINALSMGLDGKVYDYVNGLPDIEARHVRFIGDAASRIREDYLRILRFFRFHAVCGKGALDREGLKACITEKEGLRGISRERVRHEFLKTLVAEGGAAVITVMQEQGILDLILPGSNGALFHKLAQCERTYGIAPDPMRGLAALQTGSGINTAELAKMLRLGNAEKKHLAEMEPNIFRQGTGDEAFLKAALYRLKPALYRDQVLLAAASGEFPCAEKALVMQERWHPPVFPLSGKDILAKGIPAGPAVGIFLKEAETLWIESGFPCDPDTLGRLLDKACSAYS